MQEVIDSYADFIQKLPEKPIIIGHSLGGLMTQVLINRGLGVAGAAIHSVPPQGVFPYEFSFLKAGWKALGLFTSLKKTYLMSLSDWQYALTNGMPQPFYTRLANLERGRRLHFGMAGQKLKCIKKSEWCA
ncbi:alpha/beta fold hydrolase [Dyadobacter psychrophilus]|uniref:alpha/beta fold hydrolase n=1 Tax=Dyadobacter psychrophilus TaxID=651661 RepID=UPI001E63C9D5|nr:alpha/beta fold hydrolase [Dyadobacter psychrophilus]